MTLQSTRARHLLSRVAFGGNAEEIRAFARYTPARAAAALLATHTGRPTTAPPPWVHEPPPPPGERMMNRKARRRTMRQRMFALKAWWWRELIATRSPLTEWMTVFWHGHFTSESRKVKIPQLMYRQNALLRARGLGPFGDLLRAIARDPAMILYLDNQTNDRRTPNENFARELLELFTLGEGHYTERDVKEAARAFTGWRIRKSTGAFHFARHKHDPGLKTFLGRSGHFGGDDILHILLAQPRVAEHIVEKVWLAVLSPTPDPHVVRRLASDFLANGLHVGKLMTALLTSEAFLDAPPGQLIKSPVDLVAGTARLTGVRIPSDRNLVQTGRALGQDLLDPPNVKGWAGGRDWINTTSLLRRYELLQWVAARTTLPPQEVLFAIAPGQTSHTGAAILDPHFQLK